LAGLEVDDQLEFRGLLHRQVGGLLAPENAAGVDAGGAQADSAFWDGFNPPRTNVRA
jgi:hypothetical protein